MATSTLAAGFLEIEQNLAKKLCALKFGAKVSHVYNPIEYAVNPHRQFLEKYCMGSKTVLFVGMNPGPYGMAQTGVPFGAVSLVRDWLQISGSVAKPAKEHPKKPVLGFNCKQNEVSGMRFWTLMKSLAGEPDNFFRNCLVYNYCPLLFLSSTGANVTPVDLPVEKRNEIHALCDQALIDIIRLLGVKIVVGIGKYVYDGAVTLLESEAMSDVSVQLLMHPSPANPAANKGWDAIAQKQLRDAGVLQYIKRMN